MIFRTLASLVGAALGFAQKLGIGGPLVGAAATDLSKYTNAEADYEAGKAVEVVYVSEGGKAGHLYAIEDGGAAHAALQSAGLIAVETGSAPA
jgi:hypothetical protein